MKSLFTTFILLAFTQVHAQHKLTKLWETETVLPEAESVVLLKHHMFVSLVDGQANEKDGKGGVAKVGLDGKIINASWLTGLNGPTGMDIWKNKLYVTNIDEVVVVDTATAKIINRISFPEAKGLNDVAIDGQGKVYVSDPKAGIIYRILDNKPQVYLTGLPGVNGLKAIGDDLYMVTTDQLFRYNSKRKLIPIAAMPKPGADGITTVSNGDFLFTIYSGLIYYLHKNGQMELLLDTVGTTTGSADIGYDQVNHILYVPTLFRKSIVAYSLH